MPQMAPLNWLMMFLCFSLILLMFNSMNYFIFSLVPEKSMMNKKEKITTWLW
nr:ATP synthase F0 subunit 8 [Chlamisus sp. N29]